VNEANRKQIIVLAVLMLVAAVFVFRSLSSVPGGGSPSSASKKETSEDSGGTGIVQFQSVFDDVSVNIQELIQNIELVEFQYDDVQIARDPSLPITEGTIGDTINPAFPRGSPSITPDSLVYLAQLKEVTAIIYDETRPMAVVGEKIVEEGYEFRDKPDDDPIVVKSIGKDFVVLSIPSEDQEITKELIKEQ